MGFDHVFFLIFLFSVFIHNLLEFTNAQMPGFMSLDCGGEKNHTDKFGIEWSPDDQIIYGTPSKINIENETRQQYQTLRYFPADNRKYCYSLNVKTRTRYLVRATFLYGNFDINNVYPKFDISLGPTHWATVVISSANVIESHELIFLASDPMISVCLSNSTTGLPFISTLELRQFNGSLYLTPFENQFYMSVSARINFGSDNEDPVRYPDDLFDRIWQSDLLKKANYLVDVAAGTEKISTNVPIKTGNDELPPQKVMQTAVVGRNGALTYRLNLDGFPGFGWACTYLAEIEDLKSNGTRKFHLILPGEPQLSKAIVNIEENAQGKYRVYEPGFTNISLPFVLSFKFAKTTDSTEGPLINAIEINKYLEISAGSFDGDVAASVASGYKSLDWAQEGGDPCLPVPWSWLECDSDPQPKIISIKLSNKNITGSIPSDLAKFSSLEELWLDGNAFSGSIPDFTGCPNLRILHLENNQLTGAIPSSLANLPKLSKLFVQNNLLSGSVPSALLNKNIVLNYTGNNLHKGSRGGKINKYVIFGLAVGAAALIIGFITSCLLFRHRKKDVKHEPEGSFHVSTMSNTTSESGQCFTLSELKFATKNFEKKVGSGGFGTVYYGKLSNGKEIAVKVLGNNNVQQGKKEFANEVSLLSRIHHRNLVKFYGFCQEEGKDILVYEFMHNGTLKEHLYGPLAKEPRINWIKRLEIAEDAAKGIEYLHTGCVPSIIHRDLKTNNILLDINMKAKVSDFGLSKLAIDGTSHVSSIVRGTVGYLDPEYYISNHLTDKSDIYSFGVILLELISGKEAISNQSFGTNYRNIVQWAKFHIENGDIQGIVDPCLGDEFDIQSMWKIAEKALMCVQPHANMRPAMSEVIKEIRDAILIERGVEEVGGSSEELSWNSFHSSLKKGLVDTSGIDPNSFHESITRPSAR
ncbi:probable LRR receptor-like serine/threonine-protein kinase At1g67720 [Rutidosis leptorrhynchoides]|uniref:probable LRR receptor-like serine/threonine-protein kinase At1g67720 n=1 Tax=Rutidosis leptorrhynchoides TaxID=125765 RepID=UPI003A98D512